MWKRFELKSMMYERLLANILQEEFGSGSKARLFKIDFRDARDLS